MDYEQIYKHYEGCFEKHGDCPKGVDWPNEADAIKRFRVMMGCMPASPTCSDGVTLQKKMLIDFGCGSAQLLDYLKGKHRTRPTEVAWDYVGVDISQKFIDACKEKHPLESFVRADILQNPELVPSGDLVIANGVFTMKMGMSYEEMLAFFKRMITALWEKTEGGLAFNVMSKQVDWERDDLFHLSHDALAEFLCKDITRDYVIRNDYGLYEYTTYVYR